MFIHFFMLRHKKSRRFLSLVVESSMSSSLEAKIIDLHLRHSTQEEIVVVLKTGKLRIFRRVR
jgi:hypothetical protein